MTKMHFLLTLLLFALILPLHAGEKFDEVLKSAETAFKNKNYAEAEKKYVQAETLAANNDQKADALIGQANIWGEKENWKKLEQVSDKIRSLKGLSIKPKVLAVAYSFLAKLQLKKYGEAEKLAIETSENPSFPRAARISTLTNLLARVYFQQLKNKEALSAFRRALSLCGPLDKGFKGRIYGEFIVNIHHFLRGKDEIHEDLLKLCDEAEKCKELMHYRAPSYIIKKTGEVKILPTAGPGQANDAFRKMIRGDLKARILLDLADRKSRQSDFQKAEAILFQVETLGELSKEMRNGTLAAAWKTFIFQYADHFEFAAKQYENALALYYRLLKKKISNRSKLYCYLRIARCLTKQKKTEKAREYLEMANAVSDVSPYDRAELMIGMGDHYFETGDLASALATYQEARKIPDIPVGQISKSYLQVLGNKTRFLYLKAGKCDELLHLLDEVETSERLSGKEKDSFKDVRSRIYEEMINIKRNQKKYVEAQHFFRKALELQEPSKFYRENLLRSSHYIFLTPIHNEIEKRNYDKAERLLSEFKELPDVMKWHKYQITQLEKTISRERKNHHLNQISPKIKKGQFDEAEKLLKEALAKPDLSEETRKKLSSLLKKIPDEKVSAIRKECARLHRKRSYDEEKKKLETALAIENLSADSEHDIYLALAENCIARKKYPEAEQYLKKAENIQGISEYSLMMRYHKRIDCLLAQKQTGVALKLMEESKTAIKGKRKAENARKLASHYARMKKFDDAISVLEEIIQDSDTDPNNLAATYSAIAGIYLFRKKDLEKAEEYLEKSNAVPIDGWGWGKLRNKWLARELEKAKKSR